MGGNRSARRAGQAGKVALFVLWAAFAAIAYNIYSEIQELALISDLERLEASGLEYDEATLERIDANDARQRHAMFGYVGAIVLSLIALLLWVSRTNRACHDLGAKGMQFTPGWAWVVWFIPIVNLYRPFQVVRELWTTTDPDGKSTPLIGWWWVAWLMTGFAVRFGGRNLPPDASLDDFRQLDHFLLASHGLDIIAYGLTIVVVSKLTARLVAYQERVAPTAAVVRVVSEKSG